PDCVKAAERDEFHFYNEQQRSYLRSLVACWIGEVCTANGTMAQAAIVIDTDAPGFFQEDDETKIRCCIEEFSARISLEMALDALISGFQDFSNPFSYPIYRVSLSPAEPRG